MPAISGKVARIRYSSAGATNANNQAATLAGGGFSLAINDTGKRLWDANSTRPRVYSSTSTGTKLASSLYDVNYVQGKVVFRSARSTSLTYTIDVAYLTDSYLTGGKSWELETETDMLDVTAFSTSSTGTANHPKWRAYKPGLQRWTAKIRRLVSTGSTGPLGYDRLAAASSNLIVLLVAANVNQEIYEGRARVAADGITMDVDGLVVEELTLEGIGELYYQNYPNLA